MFKPDHPSALKALTEDEEYVRREMERYPAPKPDWVDFAGRPPIAEEKVDRDYDRMEDDGDDNERLYDRWSW